MRRDREREWQYKYKKTGREQWEEGKQKECDKYKRGGGEDGGELWEKEESEFNKSVNQKWSQWISCCLLTLNK